MTATVDLRLCGTMDHLRLLWQVGETLLESVPFEDDPEGTRYNVLLAIQEMATNILRHAYQSDQGKAVEVQMETSTADFRVELRDYGAEFNPLLFECPATDPIAATPSENGGYGIMIARMVMDNVSYARTEGKNVLSMRKDAEVPVSVMGTEKVQQGG